MKERSREIVEILHDVVAAIPEGNPFIVTDPYGKGIEINYPEVHYVFGNAMDIKAHLDRLSMTHLGNDMKFPMIALFCPFTEQRNSPDYYTKAKVRMVIACSTRKDWSNEERLFSSFKKILRPIYGRFLEMLLEDGRLDFGYDRIIPHEYSENYSFGKYGVVTNTGEEVSEPIDAIIISNLELKVKLPNCR